MFPFSPKSCVDGHAPAGIAEETGAGEPATQGVQGTAEVALGEGAGTGGSVLEGTAATGRLRARRYEAYVHCSENKVSYLFMLVSRQCY